MTSRAMPVWTGLLCLGLLLGGYLSVAIRQGEEKPSRTPLPPFPEYVPMCTHVEWTLSVGGEVESRIVGEIDGLWLDWGDGSADRTLRWGVLGVDDPNGMDTVTVGFSLGVEFRTFELRAGQGVEIGEYSLHFNGLLNPVSPHEDCSLRILERRSTTERKPDVTQPGRSA